MNNSAVNGCTAYFLYNEVSSGKTKQLTTRGFTYQCFLLVKFFKTLIMESVCHYETYLQKKVCKQ